MEPNVYQKAIYAAAKDGKGNYLVNAGAGTGKTSTLLSSLEVIDSNRKVAVMAFSKDIKGEVEKKFNLLVGRIKCVVTIKTIHSFGFAGLIKKFGFGAPNNNKMFDILNDLWGGDELEDREIRRQVCKAVSFHKNTLLSFDEIIIKYDIDIINLEESEFIAVCEKALKISNQQTEKKIYDFDDQIYGPVYFKIKLEQYDDVWVDETQDLNATQISIARIMLKKGGRLFALGDPRQAIFSWRGADEFAIPNIIKEFDCTVLPLSVCYRCPRVGVELAQTIVPTLEWAPGCKEGKITDIIRNDIYTLAKPGDVIISRTNAPLVASCLGFLRRGIPSKILGRKITEDLTILLKKSKKKSVDDFLVWLTNWEKVESARLEKKNQSTEIIHDKAECLTALCEGEKTVKAVELKIEKIFEKDDNNNIGKDDLRSVVLLSSVHRFKGSERPNVFIFNWTLKRTSTEEDNIRYVAYTRFQENLYLVSEK